VPAPTQLPATAPSADAAADDDDTDAGSSGSDAVASDEAEAAIAAFGLLAVGATVVALAMLGCGCLGPRKFAKRATKTSAGSQLGTLNDEPALEHVHDDKRNAPVFTQPNQFAQTRLPPGLPPMVSQATSASGAPSRLGLHSEI
jgi:hypothetical protein